MPSEFVGSSLMCEMGQMRNGDFQSIPLHVKVGEAVPVFGKYVKFTMRLQDAEVGDCRQSYNVKLVFQLNLK